jgi:hypothetical protein
VKVAPSVFGPAIDHLVAAAEPPELSSGVRRVIDLCERAAPHPDWASLRAIDYGAEVPALRRWFERTLSSEPPDAPLRGLYFALCQPVLDTGQVTADMELVGTGEYDAKDPHLEWLFSRHYFPESYARSPALRRLYGVAYRTHDFGADVEGALGNDAEWPIGLAFGVLAARAILEGRTTADLPTDMSRVGVAAGWAEGDMLLIGEVTDRGFVPASRRVV